MQHIDLDKNNCMTGDVNAKVRTIEISDEMFSKISTIPLGYSWKYDDDSADFELVENVDLYSLRQRREIECYAIIDRSPLWYNSLADDQKQELQVWYQEWLDVTETKKIPEKPIWL